MHEEIKQQIRDNVFENTYGGITGQGLQDTLLAMVDEASTDFSVLGYEEFSVENDYTEDSEPVVYEGKLYKFNTAHPAGPWIGTDADETTIDQQIKDGSGYFVEAAENTNIGGYQVPLISAEQIADINEAMSKGKNVVVIDATGDMRFSVRQSDAVDDDKGEAVVIDYFDKMILTYYADETIEHVFTSDNVRYESQTLTDAQKTQARTNIGAAKNDNIFTIDGNQVSEGSSVTTKTQQVSHTGTGNITLAPNILTVISNTLGSGDAVNFSFDTPKSGIVNEYMVEFTTGGELPTISFPAEVKWNIVFAVNPNSTYQISVVNNIGVYVVIPND